MIYKVSFVVQGGTHPGGIQNLDERPQELAESDSARSTKVTGVEDLIKILLVESVGLELQQGVRIEVVSERIEIGNQMPHVAVGEDQARHLRLVGGTFGRDRAIGPIGKVEAREKQTPLVAHRRRVVLPLPIELLDVIGVRNQGEVFRRRTIPHENCPSAAAESFL